MRHAKPTVPKEPHPYDIAQFWDGCPLSASSDVFGTETELRRDLGLGTANRYVAWWERLAERYRGRDYVAGYDLLNEPVANAPTSGGFDKSATFRDGRR